MGRGLGLSAVQGIVSKHRGVIRFDTAPGKGTTFTILLPTADAPRPDSTADEPEAPDATPSQRVLVVDDDDALRDALVKRLQRSGFEVVQACDGLEAVKVFSESAQSIDCILLDVSMPRLGGEEVYRKVTALRKDVPIIVMSGFTDMEALERFEGANLSGVLQKPIAAKDLLRAVGEAVSK